MPRDNLVVEARESPFVFADESRLERAVSIARRLDREWSVIGQDRGFGGPGGARLMRVVDAAGTGWNYAYDKAGNLTAVSSSASPTRTWQYNANNCLTQETHPEAGPVTYTVDALCRVLYRTDARGSAYATEFSYDAENRLRATNAFGTADEILITYDVYSNPVTILSALGVTTYTYSPSGNRLTGNGITYTYDANHRLTSLSGAVSGNFTYYVNGTMQSDPDGTAYTYNTQNMLSAVTVAGQTTLYRYGGDGLRKLIVKPDGDQQYFVHAGGALIGEYRWTGADVTPEREYVYLGGQLLASFTPTPETPPDMTVEIATPTSGTSVPYNSSTALTANVTVPSGVSVSRVEYYQSGILVGQATTAPYSVTWVSGELPLGIYTFIARLVASDGRAVSSAPISITMH